jgi:RNA polymerase sigma factor (sigma-70 family)
MSISNDILKGCKDNNNTCQELVYKHYYGYLYAIGVRYIEDVSDVKLMINESFFKAFTKMEQYDFAMPFEIWVRRIMINNCIDFLRKNKKEKNKISLSEEYVHNTVSTQQSIINYAEIQIETKHLEALLKQVPETSRKVFCLFAIEGYSHREISEVLMINEGTSKWHVNNARQILKAQLTEYVKKNQIKSYAK